jgi:hypothetical protein
LKVKLEMVGSHSPDYKKSAFAGWVDSRKRCFTVGSGDGITASVAATRVDTTSIAGMSAEWSTFVVTGTVTHPPRKAKNDFHKWNSS